MDEIKLKREIADGAAAEQLLAHPIFNSAFSETRTGLIKAMSDSAMGDEKTHNRLVIALQLLDQIEKSIRTYIQTGQMARIQLDNSLKGKVINAFRG